MHYQTVKDVVDHSRVLHQEISSFYQKLSEDQSQERVGMLLTFLKRHEDQLESSLCQFEKDKSQKVLESWLQYAPDHNMADVMAGLTVSDHMSADEVVSMALKLDDYFIDLYQGMVNSTGSSSVKAVFQNLLDMEQQEKIRVSKSAIQLNDM